MEITLTYPENKELRDRMRSEVERYLSTLGANVSYKTTEQEGKPGRLGPSPEIITTIIDYAAANAPTIIGASVAEIIMQLIKWKLGGKDKTKADQATLEANGKKLTLPASRGTVKSFLKMLEGKTPAAKQQQKSTTRKKGPKKKK